MMKQLETEIEALRLDGTELEMKEANGIVYLIIDKFRLPAGYNKQHTRLLLKIPLSYPNGNPDMFWTDPDLRPSSNGKQAQTSLETALGEQWLRFSWHPQRWNPGTDNLLTYIEFVNRRLAQLK